MGNTLIGEKTIAFSIAQEILTTSVNIPTIPANGKKILDIVRQPQDKIDIASFVKLVESDPGLFTRILKLSNSTFYSEVEKISSLRVAITRIGLVEIVNSVCLYLFQKMLPAFPDIEGFSYDDFWSHSWVCAVANRRLGHPNLGMDILPGDLYMAGMLQGLGKMFLNIHFPEDFSTCIKRARDRQVPLSTIEKDVFGTTDALVASCVLKAWNLPVNVCEAVAYHQMPELAPPEFIVIAGLTQFAYGIAEASGVGSSGDGVKLELSSTFFGQKPNLSFGKPDVREKLIEEIMSSLEDKAKPQNRPQTKSQSSGAGTLRNGNTKKVAGMTETKPEKKGMFGWIKSLWDED
jgi:HD-like signal output (HDOD) protein